MPTGKIQNISHDRGYGFIQPTGTTGREHRHFFHAKNCSPGAFERLEVGDELVFESTTNDRGLEAKAVQFVGQ